MTARTGSEAVANGRAYTSYATGMCQKFVRGPCWEVGSLYGSAIEAWNGSAEKHPGDRTPPLGAPVYYAGGNYGHAALYVGNGRIRSTDSPTTGKVSEQSLDWPERTWGLSYLGWTGDINGIDLPLEGDDMALSQSDIDKVAAAVWAKVIRSRWDGTDQHAGSMLSSAHYYAIQAGIISKEPAGGTKPGSRTTAGIIADKIDALPDE